MQVKKGDKVKVITGTAKGSEGVVLSADTATNKVTVEGVNVSPKKTKDPRTGKVTATMIAKPIDASNVKKI